MWDLTIPCDRFTLDTVRSFMRTYCHRWCFQQEKGDETGYLHYQCRISLITKKRPHNMHQFIQQVLPTSHCSPTSNATHNTGNEFYVTKVDTRVNGPWTDRDDINTDKIPTRFRNEPTWNPMQQSILNIISLPPDDRTINVLIDTIGQRGKTFLTMWLATRNKAERIPQQKDARDIMRMVMDMPKRTCYFIDLPRGTSHKDQHSIYSAIEEIKNGYAYDDRFKFRKEYFEPPHIWVFTNEKPNTSLLSIDRWKFWSVSNDYHLIPQGTTINISEDINRPSGTHTPLTLNIITNNITNKLIEVPTSITLPLIPVTPTVVPKTPTPIINHHTFQNNLKTN